MTKMEFTGKITHILPIEFVGDKNTGKQIFAMSDDAGQQPNEMVFTCFGKYSDILGVSKVIVGDTITVHYNTKLSGYNGKLYTNINAWKVEKKDGYKNERIEGLGRQHREEANDLPF